MSGDNGGAADICTDLMVGKVGQLVEYRGLGYSAPNEIRSIASETPTRIGVSGNMFHRKNGEMVGSSRRDSWSAPPRVYALTQERHAELESKTRIRNARSMVCNCTWRDVPDELVMKVAAMLTERARRTER